METCAGGSLAGESGSVSLLLSFECTSCDEHAEVMSRGCGRLFSMISDPSAIFGERSKDRGRFVRTEERIMQQALYSLYCGVCQVKRIYGHERVAPRGIFSTILFVHSSTCNAS